MQAAQAVHPCELAVSAAGEKRGIYDMIPFGNAPPMEQQPWLDQSDALKFELTNRERPGKK